MGQKFITLLILQALLLTCCSNTFDDPMKLTSKASGNLWIKGQHASFVLTGAESDFQTSVIVTNYNNDTVYNTTITRSKKSLINEIPISLPLLPAGWYLLRCTTNKVHSSECTFGIVLGFNPSLDPEAGKVCADAAAAWNLDQSQYLEFADIVKIIGLPMVRDRIRWSDVEPHRGEFSWGRYEALINALAARGIGVDETWHDIPDWAIDKTSTGASTLPRLDDIHNFCFEAAKHFRGKVTAWEVWNEPDNNKTFFNGSPNEFYGILAEAYKAIKEGSNNQATVLHGAMCLSKVSDFARDLFDKGAANYTDAFNWHSYETPDKYSEILNSYQTVCKVGTKPSWMTEAGIFLGTASNGELSTGDTKIQCQYIPKSVAYSLACGNTKHFYFILSHYNENGACLGALRKDLTPNPSVVALSAAANFLGDANYSRTLELHGTTLDKQTVNATGIEFTTPKENVIVCWANEKCDSWIKINSEDTGKKIEAANMFGDKWEPYVDEDGIFLALDSAPTYILIPK